MLGILIKKQLMEIFRGYFYDTKKNKARSKWATVGLIVIFAVLMIGLLGGMFYGMAYTLCEPLHAFGLDWLYFALTGLVAIFLGILGGVFTTFTGLYLAKDNDLLLSMPIPVRTIVAGRLVTVYLLGLMYSGVVTIPAVIVYWTTVKPGAAQIIGGILLVLLVSAIVLALTCLLGYGVARLSIKLKNKSYLTTIIALVFVGLYYFFYFKAAELIQDFLNNLAVYAETVEKNLGFMKTFGQVGTGEWVPMAVSAAVVFALCAITWTILLKSFAKIATASTAGTKAVYREKTAKMRSLQQALGAKEMNRFTSSANYMLNCGMSLIFLVLIGGVLLVKGREFMPLLDMIFGENSGAVLVILVGALSGMASMTDPAVPSVSLEGKSIWILQSLPVDPWEVLKAKMSVQLKITVPALLLAAVGAGVAIQADPVEWLFLIVLPLLAAVFFAALGLLMGLKFANLNWTNEIYPIKQSMSVLFYLLLSIAYGAAVIGLYFLGGIGLGPELYLTIVTAVTALLAFLLLLWLKKKGAARFAEL
ncbi:MAG: hypothetical protein IKI82_02100 [Lachnospiraceae bacterium]|nr:hypothetical protein [Lachnospiraceae bacterium]